MPIVSKLYCSSSQTVLGVRRRPHVVNGGGFVVTDCSTQKGGMVEALSLYKKWKGYNLDYEGLQNMVFTLKESNSCLVKNNGIRISVEPRAVSSKGWNFEIRGYFPDKCCSIVDTRGNIVAQVGVNKEVEKLMESKDVYHVVVKPGMDQAFVFGVIAILDYIYGESTNC
ncbi:Tubby-like, C-terminal [Sesbania bispinosa]|nr:Tubby-like, C-terminal [Sesbania bispinosa]